MRAELRAAIVKVVVALKVMPIQILAEGPALSDPLLKFKPILDILPQLSVAEQLELINSDFDLLLLMCVNCKRTLSDLFNPEKIEVAALDRIYQRIDEYFAKHSVADIYQEAFIAILINLLDLSLRLSASQSRQQFKQVITILFEKMPLPLSSREIMFWLAAHKMYPQTFFSMLNGLKNASLIGMDLVSAAHQETYGITPIKKAIAYNNLDFILLSLNLISIYCDSKGPEMIKFERGITEALLSIAIEPEKLRQCEAAELKRVLDYLHGYAKPGVSTWMYETFIYAGFEKKLLKTVLSALEIELKANPDLAAKFDLTKYGVVIDIGLPQSVVPKISKLLPEI